MEHLGSVGQIALLSVWAVEAKGEDYEFSSTSLHTNDRVSDLSPPFADRPVADFVLDWGDL